MQLLGWTTVLPSYIEEAVNDGRLTVKRQKANTGDYELLEGEVFYRGCTIAFVGHGMTVSRVPATQNIFMLREIARLTTVG